MKVAVSIPDDVFGEADQVADRLGVSRSEFYARAIAAYLDKVRSKRVREALDRVYATEGSSVDPRLVAAQFAVVPREDW
jgi:metal-responsive CopG/Arc/MetJ family transcriptional regulator